MSCIRTDTRGKRQWISKASKNKKSQQVHVSRDRVDFSFIAECACFSLQSTEVGISAQKKEYRPFVLIECGKNTSSAFKTAI